MRVFWSEMLKKFPRFLSLKTLIPAAVLLPAAVAVSVPARGAINHSDASLVTYTDFGQNCGRYATGNVNALLAYLNADGVKISYTGGQAEYTLLHGMIDFSSQCDGGYGAAIGYNFFATVQHNGVNNCTYAGNYIGSSNAIHYQSIEYRTSENNTFLLTPSNDYKITRQSKLLTDVTGSVVYGSADGDYSGISSGTLSGQLLYRSGSGTMAVSNYDGSYTNTAGAYVYITGGIMTFSVGNYNADDGAFSTFSYLDYSASGVSTSAPLPYAILSGDSGSPTWVWNENTQQYEYLNAGQSGNVSTMSQSRGAAEWTAETMASFDKKVEIGADNIVYINGVTTETETTYSDSTNGVSTTLWAGTVTNADGETLQSFVGVKSGTHTWLDLNSIKDTDNWYSYDETYLNASSSGSGKDLSYADLFYTENLVFKAASATETQQLILADTVDLGIGYVQFSKADGAETAKFTVSAAENTGALLNSAGYVVDAGVEVHLQLTNPSDYMREWRKIGDGDLYIEGTGDNDALLNLGGNGTTYLNRENGYAAYNVLANNETTVVIQDIGQIKRDFTFGFRGGLLDMNGNSMTWDNDNDASAEGFTIHALDEGAIIANLKAGTTTTLTWTQSGDRTWLGSFADTENSALKFVYNGGEGSSLTMHGIYTNLKNADSGIAVASGNVSLVGTNTVHGLGSATGKNNARFSNTDDWHYAGMATDVEIRNGASFTLDSHARLTGNVTVQDGGTFIMREGVKYRYEYIEGGQTLEDTNAIADFFGLKGDIALTGGNASLKIEYGDGVSAAQTYAGNISGDGNVSVALGTDGATLTLSGNNTFSGTKTLTSGGLVAESRASIGDVSQNVWLVGEKGWLAVKGDSCWSSTEILGVIDAASTGVLALTEDRAAQIDLASSHSGVILGAAEGCVVNYGAAGTTERLVAIDGKWTIGGGGGELVVNFLLTGTNDLVLGNKYGKGVVTLANTANDFTGTIAFAGGVTLNYTDAAVLGNARIDLSYTNRAGLTQAAFANIPTAADGVLLVDEQANETFDLSGYGELSVGANADTVFTGEIKVAENGAYRFGGTTGTLVLSQALAANGTNDLVLDAQTYSGGAVMLAQQAEITGTVSIMAFDSSKLPKDADADAGGDITLTFAAGNDNALAKAAGTTVSSGGVIDLNGTTQTLKNLSVESGGSVVDSAGAGTLVVNSENASTTLAGTLSVSSLEKIGAGTLVFSGSSVAAETLTLRDGVVAGANSNAFSGIGTIAVLAGETGVISTASSELTFANAVNVAEAGTLEKTGAGTLTFSGDSISIANAKISEGVLQIYNDAAESGASKTLARVELAQGSALSQYSGKMPSEATTVGELALAGDATLQTTWYGGDWTVNALTLNENVSSATLTLNAAHDADNFSIFELGSTGTEAGNFAGTLAVSQTDTGKWRGTALIISNADIAKNAVITNAQTSGDAILALGVHADEVKIAGLSNSATNSALFSGTLASGQRQVTSESSTWTSVFQTSWIQDGGARTLTIDTAAGGEYTFAGTVVGDAETGFGLSLVKTGAGTQKFTGSSIVLNDVFALGGTLTVAPASGGSLEILGEVSVARGATLTLGDTFSLNEGKNFFVRGATDSASASANFTGTLLLNGGVLAFEGASLKSESSALALGGLQISDALASQSVSVSITGSLAMIDHGIAYQLSDQDWSSVGEISLSFDDDTYSSAEISKKSNGLFVTFTLNDGIYVWKGTETENTWTDELFGVQGEAVPATSETALFNDRGTPTVSISGNVSAGTLLFDSTQNYTLSAADENSTLTASALEQVSESTTTLVSGVSVTGATAIGAGGEVIVKSAETLQGEISGAGTLGVDWSGSGTLNLADIGELHVINGQYVDNGTAANASSVRVDAGGQFFASVDQSANFSLSGASWTDGNAEAATLRLSTGATISGNVSLAGDSAVLVAEGDTGTISGALATGTHTLTKVGAGALTLSGEVSGALAVNSGAGTLEFSGTTGTVSSLSGDGNFSMSGTGTLTIDDLSGFSGNITKTGTGTLSVSGSSAAVSWTFVGAALGQSINFNRFADSGATITLVGAAGCRTSDSHSFFEGGSNVYAQNLILTADAANGRDYGIYLNDGNSNTTTTFTGKITGDGAFIAAAKGTVTDKFVFSGDVSEFTGGFQIGTYRTVEFSDNGGATSYADSSHVSGTGSISGAGTVIFNFAENHDVANALTASAVQKTGAGTLTLTNALLTGTIVVSGGVLDLTQNQTPTVTSSSSYAGTRLTVTDGAVVRIADCGWGVGTNLATNFNNDRIYLSNGGVLEVTQTQTAGSGARRSFTVSEGTGIYRYSGTGTNTLEHYSDSAVNDYCIGLANGAKLQFDVVNEDAELDVSKTIGTADKGETTGSVEKIGAGTLRLSGDNKYSGGTTISEGKIVVETAAALGLGPITVNGGQLSIGNGVTLSQSEIALVLSELYRCDNATSGNAVSSAAIIGDASASAISTFAISTFALSDEVSAQTENETTAGTLASGTKITLQLSESQLSEIASLTAGEALSYHLWEESSVSLGDNEFAADGSSFTYGEGWNPAWIVSYADGVLTVTIPEPGAFGLFAGTLALALAVSRRRRRAK